MKKLECANHTYKSYRAKLESIVQDNPRYKGRGGLAQKVIRRLAAAARAAIRMHSNKRDVNQLTKCTIEEEIRTEQHQLRDENEARLCAVRVIDTLLSGLLNVVLAVSDCISLRKHI